VQAIFVLWRKRQVSEQSKIFDRGRIALLAYLVSTLILATLGVAGNVKYSEIIWIDSRGSSYTPEELIINGLAFWETKMALTW
jgi:hypothetical protein